MWRTSILALAAALGLAGCGSSHGTRSSSTTAPPKAKASSASASCVRLRARYVGTQGAPGHLEVTIALRNASPSSCRLKGYPVAALRDAAGRAIPMRLQRGHGFFPDTERTPRSVTLKPGASARFGLSFVTNREYAGAHTCRTAASAVAGMSGWSYPISLRQGPKIAPCGTQLVVSPVYA
jgi:hypothetical protein